MNKDKVIFVGNGLNRLSRGYSWKELLTELCAFVGCSKIVNLNNKPFPLLYEELYLTGAYLKNIQEIHIKQFIARSVANFDISSLHELLLESNTQNILTTNYDFTLEKAFSPHTARFSTTGYIKESRYSLFRRVSIQDRNIWHLHGDQNNPNSIALGYEHYSGYLQQMRAYVVSGVKYKMGDIEPLMKRIKVDYFADNISWLDLFFTKDVYVLGFDLDFVEMHMWWLLTFRARMQITKRIPIKNRIVYIYPSDKRRDTYNVSKLELLRANKVITMPIELKSNDWKSYYKQAIKHIKDA